MLNFVMRLTRWREWYESKLSLLFVAGCTWLVFQPLPALEGYVRLLLWLAFSAFYLAFGYAINDHADREVDRLAGKPNKIGELTPMSAYLWLLGLMGLGVLMLLPFAAMHNVAFAAALSYLLAFAYSVPPVRLKERGLWGISVSAFAQRSAPLLVGMTIFSTSELVSWVMVVWFTLIGLRWILVHQLVDARADELAQVQTFARGSGESRTAFLMTRVLFPVEVATLLIWLYLLCVQAPTYSIVVPVYATWVLISYYSRRGVAPLFDWKRYGFLPFTDLYCVFLPLSVAVLLMSRHPQYTTLLILYVALQFPFIRSRLRQPLVFWRLRTARYMSAKESSKTV